MTRQHKHQTLRDIFKSLQQAIRNIQHTSATSNIISNQLEGVLGVVVLLEATIFSNLQEAHDQLHTQEREIVLYKRFIERLLAKRASEPSVTAVHVVAAAPQKALPTLRHLRKSLH
ncbi:hypothetical protein TWF102_006987 [Orbilia oligospora]|uniref:Uncharacterized protein n=1 Tax=Orbilia oligospora TaxID=2813651 RepID=A0A7C8NGI6_ORBOL|nr:hypothetical protein TWF103_005861 [Orbilia oligospora]KAF3111314.1 hypothetical protein TWF102_006987 [Orbilia oligospora]